MVSYGYVQPQPFNVLVALADADPNDTSMISGMRGHYALFCDEPVSAIIAVENGFSPDVAIIDLRLPDATRLAQKLIESVAIQGLTCVALCHPLDMNVSPHFTFRLSYPVVVSELEQLFLAVARSSRQTSERPARHRSESIDDCESVAHDRQCIKLSARTVRAALGVN